MSDLVKRLRYLAKDTEAYESSVMMDAADRIAELEAKLEKAQHKVMTIILDDVGYTVDQLSDKARRLLAEMEDK